MGINFDFFRSFVGLFVGGQRERVRLFSFLVFPSLSWWFFPLFPSSSLSFSLFLLLFKALLLRQLVRACVCAGWAGIGHVCVCVCVSSASFGGRTQEEPHETTRLGGVSTRAWPQQVLWKALLESRQQLCMHACMDATEKFAIGQHELFVEQG